jgi:hypothetical protein
LCNHTNGQIANEISKEKIKEKRRKEKEGINEITARKERSEERRDGGDKCGKY